MYVVKANKNHYIQHELPVRKIVYIYLNFQEILFEIFYFKEKQKQYFPLTFFVHWGRFQTKHCFKLFKPKRTICNQKQLWATSGTALQKTEAFCMKLSKNTQISKGSQKSISMSIFGFVPKSTVVWFPVIGVRINPFGSLELIMNKILFFVVRCWNYWTTHIVRRIKSDEIW